MEDIRDKLIEKGYQLPLVMAVILIILFGAFTKCNAQTKDSVRMYCEEIGIERVDFIVAQSQLETGYYKCTSCSLRYNNILGWWNGDKYLKFDHWKESVDYYIGWMERKNRDQYESLEEFLKARWGAPDMDKYIGKVEWIMKNK
jgi:hypothetical protein